MSHRAVTISAAQLLLNAIKGVYDWHQLGVRLGLEMSQLCEIEQSYHTGGVSLMKSEMMSLWLRNTPSWCILEEAVHVHCYTHKLYV